MSDRNLPTRSPSVPASPRAPFSSNRKSQFAVRHCRGLGFVGAINVTLLTLIGLGLVVQLGRHTRAELAEQETRDRLSARLAVVRAVDPPVDDALDEALLRRLAQRQARDQPEHAVDAWGRPMLALARGVRGVGLSPGDRPFVLSPGPDGLYLTGADNLYSYDLPPTTGQAEE